MLVLTIHAASRPVRFQSTQGSKYVEIKEIDRAHDDAPEGESPRDSITYSVDFLNKEEKVIKSAKFFAENDLSFSPEMVFKEIKWSPNEEIAILPQSKGGWGYSPHGIFNLTQKYGWEKSEVISPRFNPVWNGNFKFYFVGESDDFIPSIMEFDVKMNVAKLLKKGSRHFHYYMVKLAGGELLMRKVPFNGDVEVANPVPLCASFSIQSAEFKDIECPSL